MRELRRDQHATVASRRHRTLPLQRLRTLLQDERTEQAAHQTETKTGKSTFLRFSSTPTGRTQSLLQNISYYTTLYKILF